MDFNSSNLFKSITVPAFVADTIKSFCDKLNVKMSSVRAKYLSGTFTLTHGEHTTSVCVMLFQQPNCSLGCGFDAPANGIYLLMKDSSHRRVCQTADLELKQDDDKHFLVCSSSSRKIAIGCEVF
jgi:hypothetical protein